MSNNQSKFCLLRLQCVFLKILLPTLHKFFKMFHMIYTFLPQLSKKQSVECSRLVSKHKKKSETKIQLFPPQVFKFDLTQWYFFLHWNFNQNQSKDFSTRDIFLWHEGSTKIKTRDLSWVSLDYHFLVSTPQRFISDTTLYLVKWEKNLYFSSQNITTVCPRWKRWISFFNYGEAKYI